MKQNSTSPPQGDLFVPAHRKLLDPRDLAQLYDLLNEKHFGGKLPSSQVEWSSRLRIAGNCCPQTRQIKLSIRYHTHYPEEIESTLIHEMLHLLHPSHNAAFRQAASQLGVGIHCREYPEMHPRSRYVYICPGCRMVFRRQKRANVSCGKCSGKKYDPRYRLVLKKSPTPRPLQPARHS